MPLRCRQSRTRPDLAPESRYDLHRTASVANFSARKNSISPAAILSCAITTVCPTCQPPATMANRVRKGTAPHVPFSDRQRNWQRTRRLLIPARRRRLLASANHLQIAIMFRYSRLDTWSKPASSCKTKAFLSAAQYIHPSSLSMRLAVSLSSIRNNTSSTTDRVKPMR